MLIKSEVYVANNLPSLYIFNVRHTVFLHQVSTQKNGQMLDLSLQ